MIHAIWMEFSENYADKKAKQRFHMIAFIQHY